MNCRHRSLNSTKYLDVDETVCNDNRDEDSVIRGDITMAVPIPGQDDDDVDWIIFDVDVGYFSSCGNEVTIFSGVQL